MTPMRAHPRPKAIIACLMSEWAKQTYHENWEKEKKQTHSIFGKWLINRLLSLGYKVFISSKFSGMNIYWWAEFFLAEWVLFMGP